MTKEKRLRDRELNPGLPRDRRGYLPLYYRGFARTPSLIFTFKRDYGVRDVERVAGKVPTESWARGMAHGVPWLVLKDRGAQSFCRIMPDIFCLNNKLS